MSINDDPGYPASITAHERALSLFTDRISKLRLFASYLNDDPPQKKILFFYGDGGNGKSWLLRILRERYCRRLKPNSWAYMRQRKDEHFVTNFEQEKDYTEVPSAYLDFFDVTPHVSPRDAFHGLRLLREQLGKQGLKFYRYDIASWIYLTKGRGESRESARSLFPSEDIELIELLIDYFSENKTAQLAAGLLRLVNISIDECFELWLKRRKLDPAYWQWLKNLDPKTQLYFELPELFAKDLNDALEPSSNEEGQNEGGKRIVLFFDSHEAFWGLNRTEQSKASYFQEDEWLRRLLLKLDRGKGIVTVVAGRVPPRWHKALRNRRYDKPTGISTDSLNIQHVGNLELKDADEYLKKAGVDDEHLREVLVRQAEVELGQVHPLYVGLCGDIALTTARQGQSLDLTSFAVNSATTTQGWELMNCLLSYCPDSLAYAVKALAAARAFDWNLFIALGEKHLFEANQATYGQLLEFSFVWPSHKGEGWFRIHQLLRRVLGELDEKQTALANEVLEDLYRKKHASGDETAIVEAIYHANRLDWNRGYLEWCEVFEAALKNSRHGLCESLLELRPEIRLGTDYARGMLAFRTGEFALESWSHEAARSYLAESLLCYERALQSSPTDVGARIMHGNALQCLADLFVRLDEPKEAEQSYLQAIDSYKKVLCLVPNRTDAHINRGNALAGLAALLRKLGNYPMARNKYREAVADFDAALLNPSNLIDLHTNRGNALSGLAEILERLHDHEAARDAYVKAIIACNEALQLAPDYAAVHNNLGNALTGHADLLTSLPEHNNAAGEFYEKAILSYDKALQIMPNLISTHINKSRALIRWISWFFTCKDLSNVSKDLSNAMDTIRQAEDSSRLGLELAPQNPELLINMAWAKFYHANLESITNGVSLLSEALSHISQVLTVAPNHPGLAEQLQFMEDFLRHVKEQIGKTGGG